MTIRSRKDLRCRDDRAASDFSLLTRIDLALENLIAQAGYLGCNLGSLATQRSGFCSEDWFYYNSSDTLVGIFKTLESRLL